MRVVSLHGYPYGGTEGAHEVKKHIDCPCWGGMRRSHQNTAWISMRASMCALVCKMHESGQSVWVSLVGGRGCACSTKYVDCPCWGGMLRSRQNMARIHLVRASVCPGLQYMTVHCTLNTDPHLATPCPGVLLVSVWGDPSGGRGMKRSMCVHTGHAGAGGGVGICAQGEGLPMLWAPKEPQTYTCRWLTNGTHWFCH